MKLKRTISFILVFSLFICSAQVKAGNQDSGNDVHFKSVELTESNRYNPKYYQKPKAIYPKTKLRTYGLKSEGKTLEDYLVEEIKNMPDTIDVSDYQVPADDIADEYFTILQYHPELFYVKHTTIVWNNGSGYATAIAIRYTGEKDEISSQVLQFEMAARQAAAQTDPSMTDVEKALTVHDYLIQNCEYARELESGKYPEFSYRAYGVLVDRMAVCQGYTEAYLYIMRDKLGIPCEIVGSPNMGHAWNMIEIDGKWYHVDLTWDDPTFDCIGRVYHKYFLISDTVMSRNHHGYEESKYIHSADSTLYDTAFWTEITSSIIHYNGEWYYSKYQEDSFTVELLKKSTLFQDNEQLLRQEKIWGYYANFMYPVKANNMMYFNTREAIWQLDSDGNMEKIYEPEISSGEWIYGFTVRDNEFLYTQSDPNSGDYQVILRHPVPEQTLLELQGISADDINATYDGTSKEIIVNGVIWGDIVQYALEGDAYQFEQPEMINAGEYEVMYLVKREGYLPFESSVHVSIERAVPIYNEMELMGLTGECGNTLSSVRLPEGFEWQTDEQTVLSAEGDYQFAVKYIPADSVNYQEVTDILVTVTVSCPAHVYIGEVTIPATYTQKGVKTYTCNVCGDSYTEEIPILEKEPEVTESPKPTEEPKVTESPRPTETPKVTESPRPTEEPEVTESPKPTEGPEVTESPRPTEEPEVTESPKPTDKPEVTESPKPTENPKVTESPKPTEEPKVTESPKTIEEPKVTESPKAPLAVKIRKVKKGKGRVKLTWKKTVGAAGYVIYMRKGSKSYKKIKTIKKGKKLNYTKRGLKKKITYKFRIRAYSLVNGKKVYGNYGKAKTVKLR